MTLKDVYKKSLYYRPAISMDGFMPVGVRRLTYKTFTFLFVVMLSAYILFSFGSYNTAYGITLVLFSIWSVWSAWEMFYNSLQSKDPHITHVTPLVARLVLRGSSRDVTKALVYTDIGLLIMKRLGINKKDVRKFFKSTQRETLRSGDFFVNDAPFVDLVSVWRALIDRDAVLRQFLFTKGIQEEHIAHVCLWMERQMYLDLAKIRWWTRDALLRIPSIGVAFSYGRAYLLEKYALKVEGSHSSVLFDYFEDELDSLELILTRSKEANALVVGSRENIRMINLLQKKMQKGNVHPQIEHKELFMLHTEELLSGSSDKVNFESTFIKILKEIRHAGNIILVLPDFPSFIAQAQTLGSDVLSMLDTVLISADVQVIAFTEQGQFHQILESNQIIQERFEKLFVSDKEKEIIRTIVENYISLLEKKNKLFFEYSAIDAIVNSVERHFVTQSPIDEVTDVLVDLSGSISKTSKKVVTDEDVLELVQEKTGIPLQSADGPEKEKLLNLESFLHKRVVGQDSAISSVADALRRMRSGISNQDKPIGTFIFLGPTGVGKTETAKALAESFFGSEKKLRRLDMSEFSGSDAVARLIGSFETGTSGILSSLLREHPYGVLLLDEFEKASQSVHDLFLQILDEGIFTDMKGEKVNARNTLIIATSNAGSDLIWKYAKQGEDVVIHEKEIIDDIIESRVFKPELINRFNDVVVFHPLEKEHVVSIAEIMLKHMSDRLRKKGVDVSLTPDALEYVVEKGVSTEFGARELQRILQNTVESVVAKKMLEGEIKKGDTITLSRADIE